MDTPLTIKEKRDLTIQAGLQLLPYVGGFLSSAYYGVKQERRFKRLESFYEDLSEQISENHSTLLSIESHDQESLIALIERLNDQIEIETSEEKRNCFKNFFLHLLQSPTLKSNYDERQIFLNSLSAITFLEFQVLLSYSEYSETVSDYLSQIESDIRLGAIARLENLGLLISSFVAETYAGESPVLKYTLISEFGKNFINFCIE